MLGKLRKFRGAAFVFLRGAREQFIENFVLIGLCNLLYPANPFLDTLRVMDIGCKLGGSQFL